MPWKMERNDSFMKGKTKQHKDVVLSNVIDSQMHNSNQNPNYGGNRRFWKTNYKTDVDKESYNNQVNFEDQDGKDFSYQILNLIQSQHRVTNTPVGPYLGKYCDTASVMNIF
jgi:hypothetical protein